MPFPSGGCQTCRSRHIKCDETRPTCLNCRKAGRHCAGWRADTGSLLFLSENVYASTQTRRPRGGARWVPEFSADDISTLDKNRKAALFSPATASDGPARRPSEGTTPIPKSPSSFSAWIAPSIQQPLADLALHHFANVYFRVEPKTPDSIWSLTKQYFVPNNQLAEDDALRLSFSALSLTHYGRAQGVSAAMIEGQKKYSRALQRIRSAIENRKTALTDELLLAVMLMAAYEDHVANFDQTRLFSDSFQHHMGAIVLLKIRQESRKGTHSDDSIDRCIRRQIVRSCVWRATLVPNWLQNGADFGEDEHQLPLDKALIRLAYLRHGVANALHSNDNPSISRDVNVKARVERLINHAVETLQQLNAWRAALEPRYHYVVHHGNLPNPSQNSATLFYSTEMHKYRDVENAGMWNRYYGQRVLTDSLLVKLLFTWRYVVGDDPDKYGATERLAQADIHIIANKVCASVPFAFGVDFDCQKDLSEIIDAATPSRVYNLVWPCISIAGSPVFNELQRQWVREKLALVSKVTGNGTLAKVANMNLQYHSRLRPAALLDPNRKIDRASGKFTSAYPAPTVAGSPSVIPAGYGEGR